MVVPLPRVGWLQSVPPFAVFRIVPFLPTANPVLESMKKTEINSEFEWLTNASQVIPPLIVLRIVPFSPTAYPILSSVK